MFLEIGLAAASIWAIYEVKKRSTSSTSSITEQSEMDQLRIQISDLIAEREGLAKQAEAVLGRLENVIMLSITFWSSPRPL
jgi:hypothetical protein